MQIESASEFVQAAAVAVVFLCWVVFACVFVFRASAPRPQATRRDPVSVAGMLLQGFGFAFVSGLRRPILSPLVPALPALAPAVAALAAALAVGSIGLTLSAVRALGREWSFQARLVQGHRLVTEGPYRLVRHPIYAGMLGMLLATCLAVGRWTALVPALVLFGAGTLVRMRSEERLLKVAFGPQFEEYARRVPAVIPGLR